MTRRLANVALVVRECDHEQLALEDAGEFLNIESDIQGRDVATFACNNCGQVHKSVVTVRR